MGNLIATNFEIPSDPGAQRRFFWQQVGHDLRQPIQSLQLLSQVFARYAADDVQRQSADHMRHAVDDLSAMHEALIKLASLESGRSGPELRRMELDALGAKLAQELDPLAAAHGMTLARASLDAAVIADPKWLAKILRGMVMFAISFGTAGTIEIASRQHRRASTIIVDFPAPVISERQMKCVFFEIPGMSRSASDVGISVGPAYLKQACDALGYRFATNARKTGGQRMRLILPGGFPLP